MLIIVATHKNKIPLSNKFIKGIQVGAEYADLVVDENYLRDNQGYHISNKNPNFCELTALYWLWKNKFDNGIVGLNHYRRYLDVYKPQKKFFSRLKRDVSIYDVSKSHRSIKLLDEKNLEERLNKLLKTYDAILPILTDYSHNGKFPSLASDYCSNHIASDWEVLVDVVLDKFPEYDNSIEEYWNNTTYIYGMNMFISSYDWMNNYCKWLFEILFEVEKRIIISKDIYQSRVFGFMSERLMTLYVRHHNFKIYETQVLNIN